MRQHPRPETVESGYSWLVVALSLVIASLSFGAVTSVPILFQPMAQDLGWSRSTLGLAHALTMIAAGIGGFGIGVLADRYSFARLSLIAGIAIGAGLWLSSLAEVPWQLYAAYAFLVGALGQGTFFGPITANVSRWFDRNRALAMAVVLCGQSVGGLTVPVVLRQMAEISGWRDAMSAYGLFCAAIMVVSSLFFLRQPPIAPQRRAVNLNGFKSYSTAQLRIFASVTGALFLLNAGSFVVIAHLVAYAEEQGLAPPIAASLLSVTFGVTLFSRLAGGALVDRQYPRLVIWGSTLMLPFGALILALGADAFAPMCVGAVVFGLGYGGVFPAYISIIRSTFPAAVAATCISAMFFFGFLAAAAGSWLGGFLRDLSDYGLAFLVSIVLTSASLVLGIALLGGRHRIQAAADFVAEPIRTKAKLQP